MGGDRGPSVAVKAAIECLAEISALHLILVGNKSSILSSIKSSGLSTQDRIEIVHSDDVVAMNEKPAVALRTKKKSSMALAIKAVKTEKAGACVSAGNTGALMALSRSILGMHQGIDRPAFIREIPTLTGHCHVLDLGANIGCDARNLYQFGVMGSIVSRVVDHIDRPRVGLLNVGQEESKGLDQVKDAAQQLLNNPEINYIGFVEGDHIFADEADVIVCDGFVGNVALKTSEGLAKMVSSLLERTFEQNLYSKAIGLLSKPVLHNLVSQIDPKRHNGASLLGLKGTVVKSHGNADVAGFKQAIKRGYYEARDLLPQLIQDNISKISL